MCMCSVELYCPLCHPLDLVNRISIFPVQLQVSPALSERLRVFEYLREKQRKKKRADTADTPLSIRLAGGRTVKGTAGVTTPLFVAHSVR